MHSSSQLDVYLRFGDYHDKKLGLSTRMHLPLSKTGNKIERNLLYVVYIWCINIFFIAQTFVRKYFVILSVISYQQQTTVIILMFLILLNIFICT